VVSSLLTNGFNHGSSNSLATMFRPYLHSRDNEKIIVAQIPIPDADTIVSRICGPLSLHYAKLIEDSSGEIRTIVARLVHTAVKVVAHLLSIDECKETAELRFAADAREIDLLHGWRVITVAN
jgi:hypothetical protein